VTAAITPQERLLSLIVALMASTRGLTKDQILSTVSGYRQAREGGSGADALERMFERDKEQLRVIGVPVHTIGDLLDPNDLRAARYRIPKTEYLLPDDIDFTPAELAVLTLAGAVWSEESMSDAAQSALRKIRALGIEVDEPIIGFAPRVILRDPAFSALRVATEQAKVVRFRYARPGDEQPRWRTVAPLALAEFEGRWHVFGIDQALGEERTFLLTRIVGDVHDERSGFDPALRDGAGERALAGLEQVAAGNVAVLEVADDTEAALRLRRRGIVEGQRLRLHFVDAAVLADELASYGPEVRVLEPAALREAVIARLRATFDLHADAVRGPLEGSGR